MKWASQLRSRNFESWTMCFLIFHTTKLAKTKFVVPRRPIGIALVFGQLIWLSDPTASQWDLTQFHTIPYNWSTLTFRCSRCLRLSGMGLIWYGCLNEQPGEYSQTTQAGAPYQLSWSSKVGYQKPCVYIVDTLLWTNEVANSLLGDPVPIGKPRDFPHLYILYTRG